MSSNEDAFLIFFLMKRPNGIAWPPNGLSLVGSSSEIYLSGFLFDFYLQAPSCRFFAIPSQTPYHGIIRCPFRGISESVR